MYLIPISKVRHVSKSSVADQCVLLAKAKKLMDDIEQNITIC